MGVENRLVEYTDGGAQLEGYFAWDAAAEDQRPGVLVVHAWAGRAPFEEEVARKLAGLGYAGFAMDVYGKGVLGSDIADGQMGLLLAHCLQVAPAEDADRLLQILHSPRRNTSDEDIDDAIMLLENHGSIAFGVDLIQKHQAQVESLAQASPPGLQRLLRGLTDVLLSPLVRRVTG